LQLHRDISGNLVRQSEVPNGRPDAKDRLFVSPRVEAVIADVGSRIKDDTIRTIFSNCLPSTIGKSKAMRKVRKNIFYAN